MKLKLLILSLFISIIGYSQTISVSGTIATNTTWSADTVKVTGNITVNDLITLTITPHTYVQFQGQYSMNVYGRMLAVGSVTDSISFAIKDTTGFSNTSSTLGGWNSIALDAISPLNDTSVLEYCKITNSKEIAISSPSEKIKIEHCLFFNNLDGLQIFGVGARPLIRYNSFRNNHNIALYIFNEALPLISGNYFSNNSECIYVQNSSPEISYNTISNTNYGAITVSNSRPNSSIHHNQIIHNNVGIYLQNDTNTIISNNVIKFNGQGIDIDHSSSIIRNNTIANNSSTGGSGITITNFSTALIIFNTISNNYGSGVGCGFLDDGAGILCEHSFPLIINNIICNNENENGGGGFACLDSSSVTMINNTIVNNKTNTIAGGGGILIWGYSRADLKNNIVWGNIAPMGSDQIVVGISSLPINIDYCNFQDTMNGPGYEGINYQNIQFSDPLFVSPSAGAGIAYDGLVADWSLQSTSPCINAGTPDTTGLYLYPSDIFGDPRILNDTIDMGAYEYTPTMNISEINNFLNNGLLVYPNPANEYINIIVKNTKETNLSLKITNVLGQIVYEENVEPTNTFFYKTVNVSSYTKGVYSISLIDNKGMSYSKLIIKE